MPKQNTVTMPKQSWDGVAVLMLETARTLQAEGADDLLVEMFTSMLPPITAVVSPEVRALILEVEAQIRPHHAAA